MSEGSREGRTRWKLDSKQQSTTDRKEVVAPGGRGGCTIVALVLIAPRLFVSGEGAMVTGTASDLILDNRDMGADW